MGKFLLDYQGGKAFVGIVTKDPTITIGRVDIWDTSDGHEGISYLQAFWQQPIEGVNFFLDQVLFEDEVKAQGKVLKTSWDFKPDHLPANTIVPIDDVLDISTHPINAPGVWWNGDVDLWPPDVDNVQFSSNMFPQSEAWEPHGLIGLFYAKVGYLGINNNVLGANYFEDSFDIISGPPAGDNHTAMALELVQLPTGQPDPIFHISVYDKAGMEIGKFTVPAIPSEKLFLGIITKDPSQTIGRVDIWDHSGGAEGISSFRLYSLP
jgi:hypothetical protein